MSEDQLKAFLTAVKADAGLQEKLKAVIDADAFLTVAKEAGFMISAADLESTQSELSEEELEGAAGGFKLDFAVKITNANGDNYVRLTTNVMYFAD